MPLHLVPTTYQRMNTDAVIGLVFVAVSSFLIGYIVRSLCGPVCGDIATPDEPDDVESFGHVEYVEDDGDTDQSTFVDDESADIAAALRLAYEQRARAREVHAADSSPSSLSLFFERTRDGHTKKM